MPTKKTAKKNKRKNGLEVELLGKILLHDTEKGRTTTSELPAELILNLVVMQITQALRDYVIVKEFDDIHKSSKSRPRGKGVLK